MNFEKPLNSPEDKKRESGVTKIFGSESLKEEFSDYFENVYRNNEFYSDVEKEKTENELALIRQINEKMKGFVERYGGKFLEIKPKNIHVWDSKKFTAKHWKLIHEKLDVKKDKAVFASMRESIATLLIRGEDDFAFAKTVTHEILHFNSFQSVDIKSNEDQETKEISERRTGLAVVGKHRDPEHEDSDYVDAYFLDINEAVTEKLTKKFAREYFGEFKELEKPISMRKMYTEKVDENTTDFEDVLVSTIQKKNSLWKTTAEMRAVYEKERSYLDDLIRQIQTKNPERFKSEDEVFSLFARAYFSGNVLELARVIEGTFGKGYFRKIGEETGKKKTEKNSITIGKEEGGK